MVAALPANAQADDCKPSDAWTETIPAQGEPTILVDNPDYKPAKPAKYRTEHHEAVVTTTTAYLRYSWNPKGQVSKDQTPDVTGSNPLTHPGEWTANTTNYQGAGHGTDPLNQVFFVSNPGGQGNGSWFYWHTTEKGDTVPAWDEEILVCPGTPAQGEPKIEKKNPNYKPASTVEHEAVVCDATPTPAPSTPAPSTPTATPSATTPGLAATGSNAGTLALLAGALALLGTVVTVVTRRRLAATRD